MGITVEHVIDKEKKKAKSEVSSGGSGGSEKKGIMKFLTFKNVAIAALVGYGVYYFAFRPKNNEEVNAPTPPIDS